MLAASLRTLSSVLSTNLPRLSSTPSILRHVTANATPPPTTQSTVTPPPVPPAAPIHQHTEQTAEYNTQRSAVYRLPFYGESHAVLDNLSHEQVQEALRSYGGLIRPRDQPQTLLERLKALTNATYRPKQLTIQGVVVSNKMDKSVVIAAKRLCFSAKLQKSYHKTRRFMAHDEQNLCREGDQVVIRSCRLMSKRKSHVVVLNYGDPTRPGLDQRSIQLQTIH